MSYYTKDCRESFYYGAIMMPGERMMLVVCCLCADCFILRPENGGDCEDWSRGRPGNLWAQHQAPLTTASITIATNNTNNRHQMNRRHPSDASEPNLA